MRRDPFLHLYELGDLDDFFFPHTEWYGLEFQGVLRATALLYLGNNPPTLILLGREEEPELHTLAEALALRLPARFYAHLSPGLGEVLRRRHRAEPRGSHLRMALTDPGAAERVDSSDVVRLAPSDAEELLDLYRDSYPGNWFDPRMLETGFYLGVREARRLVAVAGVHVYSKRHAVAALGNITTHPDFRGRGLALRTTARLCLDLRPTARHVGLNVKEDNAAAIACYERLGFERIARYEEWLFMATEEPPNSAAQSFRDGARE